MVHEGGVVTTIGGSNPVSYTHLANVVYFINSMRIIIKATSGISLASVPTMLIDPAMRVPVSYPHLDVYQRQPYHHVKG